MLHGPVFGGAVFFCGSSLRQGSELLREENEWDAMAWGRKRRDRMDETGLWLFEAAVCAARGKQNLE